MALIPFIQPHPAGAWRPYMRVVVAVIVACLLGYGGGEASRIVSTQWVKVEGLQLAREPINLAFSLIVFWAWQISNQKSVQAPPNWGSSFYGLGMGWTLGVALPGAALLMMVWIGVGHWSLLSSHNGAWLIPIPLFLIHALAEEVLVRGIAQRSAHASFGPMAGVVTAAAAFGILQALQGYAGVWYLVNSTLFGAILGYIALGRGGIWAAVAAHASWAWLETCWIGTASRFDKQGGFWAGMGPDSYGSPLFSGVLMVSLGLIWIIGSKRLDAHRA
jgi:membrane protease YdiL (CAAX protease family)